MDPTLGVSTGVEGVYSSMWEVRVGGGPRKLKDSISYSNYGYMGLRTRCYVKLNSYLVLCSVVCPNLHPTLEIATRVKGIYRSMRELRVGSGSR